MSTQQQQQLQSTIFSVAPAAEEQTPATCPICLEDFAPPQQADEQNKTNETDVRENVDQEALTASDNDEHTAFTVTCRHTFCVACLVTHVGHAVETKRIPLTCPEIACRAEIAGDTLVRLLDHCDDVTTVNQVHRLQELARSPKGQKVPCTACPALVETTDMSQVDLTCPACQHSFCRNHGDIHVNLTCAEFLQTEQGRLLRQSEEALHRFTKPCSRCGALLQKANGCDYVICGHCKKDMCYRCGTHEYLQGETFRRCTECRSTYHNEVRLPMALGCIFLIFLGAFTVTLCVVWPVVAIVFVLASGCCGCFFRCGQRLESSKRKQARKRRQASSQNDNAEIEPLQPPPPPYQPGRGILAVVVIVFLPLAMLLDGAVMMVRGTEDGFLDTLLPELSAKAEEIPALELTSTPRTVTADDENEDDHLSSGDNHTKDEEEVPDLENGFGLSGTSNDDDDNDQRVHPAAAE